ncbi:MAG: hypothetical protein RI953_377 [Pseudomonadota bacterium]|jgi:endonuclease/exonuclease/phosphatase family metal-dependent hydrolase
MQGFLLGTALSFVFLIASSCAKWNSFSGDPSRDSPASVKASPQPTNTITPSDNPQLNPAPMNSVHRTDPIPGVNELKLLCGTVAGSKVFEQSAGRAVRIATVNMYGAFSSSLDSLKARIELHAQSIVKSKADAVGLQEAEDMLPAGLSVEMLARRLSELSGETWHWCFLRSNPHAPLEGDSTPGGGGPLSAAMAATDGNTKKLGLSSWFMGDAIVSRVPFGSAGGRRISGRFASEYLFCQTDQCRQWALGESRVVMRAELMLKGQSLHFFNSHFYTNITSDSAKSQVRQVSEISSYINEVSAKKKSPSLLTCDCNSSPEGGFRAELLKFGFTDAWSATNSTQSGSTGGQNLDAKIQTATSRIDYVFLKDVSPAAAHLIPEAAAPTPLRGTIFWPSDHLGIVVELKSQASQ